MSTRRLLLPTWFALTLTALGLLAAAGRSAPAAKEAAPVKTPDGGIVAEPAGGDGAGQELARKASQENLKRLVLAVHAYADDHEGRFPTNTTDKDGKPLLSWRVHLLPYLDQADLYKQFQRDQPWESDRNKKLLARMPKVFASPRVKLKVAGHTVYQGFAGPGALFEPGKRLALTGVTDGLSNTILAVEASVAFPWTRPADLPFDPKADLPDFGKAYGSKPLAAMSDSSVRTLDLTKVSPATLKAAITTAGGEVLGADW